MEQPPELPPSARANVRISVKPAPIWVRFLAGAADCIVAGLFSMAIIVLIVIPNFYPETQSIIIKYAEQSTGSMTEDTELARNLLEKPAMGSMLFSSQMILYTIFFFYFLVNEWAMKGSSFGKMIFRITTVRRNPEEVLSPTTMFLRAWLKTVFLLLLLPVLWVTFLWALFQPEKRMIHDLITGTWVID